MIKGIGIDIVEHNRINIKIAHKILTKKELMIFNEKKNQVEYLASRFCVKEAIIKATNKKYTFQDLEIINNDDGQLIVNQKNLKISLSHEKNYSVGICIWEE